MPGSLQAVRHCIFTERNTPSVCSLRSHPPSPRGRQPSQSRLTACQLPRRGSFISAYRQMRKSSPFGGAGCDHREQTERVRSLSGIWRAAPEGGFSPRGPCSAHFHIQNLPFCNPSSTSYRSRHSAVYRRRISSLAGAMSGTITVIKRPLAPARTPL